MIDTKMSSLPSVKKGRDSSDNDVNSSDMDYSEETDMDSSDEVISFDNEADSTSDAKLETGNGFPNVINLFLVYYIFHSSLH